jgi:hypothetical protein
LGICNVCFHVIVETCSSTQFFQNGSPPELVAKTVLAAINSPNPILRYLAGKDIEEWVKSKNSMTDAEFRDMMMKDVSD